MKSSSVALLVAVVWGIGLAAGALIEHSAQPGPPRTPADLPRPLCRELVEARLELALARAAGGRLPAVVHHWTPDPCPPA